MDAAECDVTASIAAHAEKHDLSALTYHRNYPISNLIFGTSLELVLRKSTTHVLCVPPGAGLDEAAEVA